MDIETYVLTREALKRARTELQRVQDAKGKLLSEDRLELEYIVMRLNIMLGQWRGNYQDDSK